MHYHAVGKERRNKCEGCNAAFVKPYQLRKHVESVHNRKGVKEKPQAERKFACDYCEKRFTRSNHLQKHQLQHMAEDAIEFLYCKAQGCTKKFKHIDNLKEHLKKVHKTLGGIFGD